MISLTGYIASVLLGISLLVNNDLKFRWINTFGCFAFVIYGALIGAFPIIVTNVALFLINVFYLVKIYRTKEAFDIAAFTSGDQIISKFLEFYREDIRLYFPDYTYNNSFATIRFVVLRDMVIANIFEACLQHDGTAVVSINYTVPTYRDYKVGRFIFEKEKKYLTGQAVQRILYENVINKNHQQFLRLMKFSGEENNGRMEMIKSLK